MKTHITILAALLIMASSAGARAQSTRTHLDQTIQMLMSNPDVNKNVLINRDPDNKSLVRSASYNFKFKSEPIFKNIRAELLQHSAKADFFRQTSGNNETLLMRTTAQDGNTTSYKLQRLGKRNFLFIVNVNPGDDLNQSLIVDETDREEFFARQQAEVQRQQAALQRQAAAQQRQLAAQARQEAARARQEAARQRQEAARQRQEAARQRQQAARQRKRSGNTATVMTDHGMTAAKQAEIDAHKRLLEQQRQELERELR